MATQYTKDKQEELRATALKILELDGEIESAKEALKEFKAEREKLVAALVRAASDPQKMMEFEEMQ